jgi:hypothetical protein
MNLVTEVNKNFKIKVNGINHIGPSMSKVVGYTGLAEIIGNKALTEKICREALRSTEDVFTRKLRRGLKIRFYTQ